MTEPITFDELDFRISVDMSGKQAQVDDQMPFRIALLGDFSGRRSRVELRSPDELLRVKPLTVDRDNLEEQMARLKVAVQLRLAPGGPAISLSFSELDDFHPDAIYDRLDIFRSLRTIRKELQNPATFASAAKAVRQWSPAVDAGDSGEGRKIPDSQAAGAVADGSLLDAIVAEGKGSPASAAQPADELAALLKGIVAPHLVAKEDPRKDELVAVVDRAISAVMAAILHHPSFQAMEAAWRGLRFLLREIETGESLEVCLLDITAEELAADLLDSENLASSAMYKVLARDTVETPGAVPWAVVGGVFTFGTSGRGTEALGLLAKICRRAGAPFIAAAQDAMVGCASLAASPDPADWRLAATAEDAAAWQALRRHPDSEYVGLALPRFLLRLPYGEDTDSIDRFAFEELTGDDQHGQYLWGNSVFVCLVLLGQAFVRQGWGMRAGAVQEIDGLPLHVSRYQGESVVKPCAEVLLTERAAGRIMERGCMPLLSFVEQDRIRLGRFQSISDPPSRLAGRWG